jgi:hypothetical protein
VALSSRYSSGIRNGKIKILAINLGGKGFLVLEEMRKC